mmetsp:Transcript_50553/g.161718  ORF Transcript_50553/g.161718 Transcript_50553/m.161718 type:complete len:246 (+) Transcript_50553:2114-2851(+)
MSRGTVLSPAVRSVIVSTISTASSLRSTLKYWKLPLPPSLGGSAVLAGPIENGPASGALGSRRTTLRKDGGVSAGSGDTMLRPLGILSWMRVPLRGPNIAHTWCFWLLYPDTLPRVSPETGGWPRRPPGPASHAQDLEWSHTPTGTRPSSPPPPTRGSSCSGVPTPRMPVVDMGSRSAVADVAARCAWGSALTTVPVPALLCATLDPRVPVTPCAHTMPSPVTPAATLPYTRQLSARPAEVALAT